MKQAGGTLTMGEAEVIIWYYFYFKLDSMPIHNEGSQRSPLLRRLSRNTPFWRMITDSKPIQASCQNDYECSTKTCRDGQCTHSKYVS
ncbi:liver-expressed antimicrobial peptide 2 isoform X1 [Pristis pectinata]|uniref:liver-expressed antimicrobial peptide 2 isoform X1 n=1 Tax=Pristis pectinata TaxID=685728 RepID=UPI00223E1779|nr:liver-expressed antimicrobial peptide 2 isoform X1 [Pristis pectinata]